MIEVKHLTKKYGTHLAVDDLSFTIEKGRIYGFLGPNGAGKSTLIKILTGVYTYDEGSIIFDGSPVAFKSTNESQKAGIGSVYQELNMIPYLSVAENIYIGDYPMGKTGIEWKELYENAQNQLDSLNIDVDAKKQLNELSTAQQQMVSIVRAVSRDCKLIILDEPTSSLDTKEVKTLFSLVRQLKEKGVAFIFITHRMEEIYQICDRITVLKDGQFIGTYQAEDLNQYQLVTLMVQTKIKLGSTTMTPNGGETINKYVGQKLQRCCLEVKCRTQEKFYMKVFCRKTSRQQRPSVQDLRFAQKTGVWTVLFPI